jgi:two-component system CheB/CheR fusion protein
MTKKKLKDTNENINIQQESQNDSTPEDINVSEQEEKTEIPMLPIVGIGASAGGLEAFEQFFTNMPSDSGMAFVLVQHLDPTHKSILSELISRYTKMKVFEAKDGMNVEANCVYIIPPNRDMTILHETLQVIEPEAPHGHREPIDFFFRSLAQDQRERAICIILSGTGTGGTLGMKAVKEEGGLAMVQEPESAKYDGMPRSAIATRLADYILPPDKMPEQLIAYVRHAFVKLPEKVTESLPDKAEWLQKVYVLLRSQTGHDFSYYKKNTIIRRLERRMMVNQIDNPSDYVNYLQKNPMEIDTLFRELLIGVTNFFRDPESFDVLRERVIPSLLENRHLNQPIRVWVPACSTGEEAYSIAMLISECMDELTKDYQVQIFATDIDDHAIETARAGIYPDSIAADVLPKRLQRFFTKVDNFYHVKKPIRDMLVFAIQDIIKDPPFSRIDMISCRNLLIYMGEELQKKLIPLFHYSLNQNGYLMLGASETIGSFVDLFTVVDRKWRVFQRKEDPSYHQSLANHYILPLVPNNNVIQANKDDKIEARVGIRELTERLLLDSYLPSCVIINEKYDVIYFHGRTGKYLEPASGEARMNILEMAREGLKPKLTTAIRKAISENRDVSYEGLKIKTNGDIQVINLVVKPIPKRTSTERLMMIVFEDQTLSEPLELSETPFKPNGENSIRIEELEQELRSSKEYLQTTIEELETANEELKSTNEELQSSNEELQSTSEEMETSKEELQSVNEELVTVNVELEKKIEQLSKVNNDMINLLASTKIGTIFLDNELNIQRFTPAATQFVNLIQSDVGRPFSHIASNLAYENLTQDAKEVLDTLISKQFEVQTNDDLWYSVQIMPYRTTENVIEGVVLTFGDITHQKKTELKAQDAREYVENIVATIHESLLVLDGDLRILSANRSFYRTFKITSEETIGKFIYDLGNGQWRIPKLQELLTTILPDNTFFDDYEIEHEFPDIGHRIMLLNARRMYSEASNSQLILLAIEDITE